jgi:hypothetical protein
MDMRALGGICIPRQSYSSEQILHKRRHFDNVPQRIRFRNTDDSSVHHLAQNLRDHIIIAFDLIRQQRRAEKVLQHVRDPVQELEDEERFGIGGAWREKEQLVLDNGEEQSWRIGGG